MIRTFAIVVLVILLAASVSANVYLFRQAAANAAEGTALRVRAVSAEQTRTAVEQKLANGPGGTPAEAVAATPPPAQPSPAATPSPAASPAIGLAPAVPVPSATAQAAAGTGTPSVAVLRAIESQVMQIRGLPRKQEVPVTFLDAAGLQKYLADSFQKDYLPSEREADQKELVMLGFIRPDQDIVQLQLKLLSSEVLGIYDDEQKRMFVLQSSSTPTIALEDTYAHEFTHALQDQSFDLSKIEPKHPSNSDKASAMDAVIEGDAVLTQQLWEGRFLTAAQRQVLDQQAASSPTDPLANAPAILRTDLLFPYVQGLQFVTATFQRAGSYQGIDGLFSNPPLSTQQILHPQQYAAHKQPVEVSLPDLTGALGSGWRRIRTDTLGELDVRNLLQEQDQTGQAATVAAGWAGDSWELLEKNGKDAIVVQTSWDTPAQARSFFQMYGAGLSQRFRGATKAASTDTREALTTGDAATDLRIKGSQVLAVISFDRASSDAIVAAVGGF